MTIPTSTFERRVWFITGSSTGLGRALAERVLAHGDRVVATARHEQQVQEFLARYKHHAHTVRLDVTNPNEVREAVASAISVFGRIDVLVNNAGYGLLGAIEEAEDIEVRHQFETNLFGALAVTRAVLPHMRQQRSGRILNISSVGGFVGRAGAGIYNATKFALEGLSEALAEEVAPLGIRLTIVEPGGFRTDWAGRALVQAAKVIDDYNVSSGQTRELIASVNGRQPGDPTLAAQAMIEVVESDDPPLRLVLGADALERIKGKLAQVARELESWKQVSLRTNFEENQLKGDTLRHSA